MFLESIGLRIGHLSVFDSHAVDYGYHPFSSAPSSTDDYKSLKVKSARAWKYYSSFQDANDVLVLVSLILPEVALTVYFFSMDKRAL